MNRLIVLLACGLLVRCAATEPPLPPVPSPAEDLSQWTVPALVQPARREVPRMKDAAPTKEEQVVPYVPGVSTKLSVGMDGPVDIVFERGEEVRNIIGGEASPAPAVPAASEGSQVPAQSAPVPQVKWDQREAKHGMGESLQHHLALRANVPGLSMGLIITTTRRVYLLTCKSVRTTPIRVVRWTYAPESAEALALASEPGLLPDPLQPKRYHVGYTWTSLQAQSPDWAPRFIVDDGRKMYVIYPEVTLFGTVPEVRMIGPNGPQLVNSAQYLNVVIVDQLAPRLELRVGIGPQAEVVTIARGALRTIDCPGDTACPVWPAAASTLAQRGRP
jgi:type IV secretory pathway VirB9-like protein